MLSTENTEKKEYKRKRNLKTEFVGLNEKGQKIRCELGQLKTLTTKNYPDGLPYMEITDLDTGEMCNLWVNGGLRGLIGSAKLEAGMLVEIECTGKEEFELPDGKIGQVNTYRCWELE